MNRNIGRAFVVTAICATALFFILRGGNENPSSEESPARPSTTQPLDRSTVGAVPTERRVAEVRYDENGIAVGGVEPNPSGGIPLDIDNIIANAKKPQNVVVSRDEADTFTVPVPGEADWADYLEYRRRFRSSLDNTPGFVVPYDPEWRAKDRGYRLAPDPGLELFGGSDTLHGLLQDVLDRLCEGDEQGLVDLAVRKEEYEIICWPTFPESRPYLRYKWDEGWGFQYASILGGIKEGLRQIEALRPVEEIDTLELASVGYEEIKDYGHFQLYQKPTIRALDPATGQEVDLSFVDAVIERNGVFKVFLYAD